jgi:hypothetical protein
MIIRNAKHPIVVVKRGIRAGLAYFYGELVSLAEPSGRQDEHLPQPKVHFLG